MASLPPEDLLPILVVDLADDESQDVLEAAAVSGNQVMVPLEDAPVSASLHVLEVNAPSMAEPMYFLAEPLGPPTELGFPMRVRRMPDAAVGTDAEPITRTDLVLRGRRPSSTSLTAAHAADLSQVDPSTAVPEVSLLGRPLAGGKLTIEQLIGRGGVGAVYKARHRELGTVVAVKVLHESFQDDIDFCRRFYAEALAASRLDHPNVTRVIDFGQEPDGLLYLAMEFLDGVELRATLDKERRLSTRRIAELMMQTCAGLSHAHARGIVHRDIKPENVIIVAGHDDDGQPIELVKVCDFGIAQHRAIATTRQAGVIAGTPEYMSPEQCRGDELDARSDIYACGIVLYELATGQTPFISERAESLLNKHQFTQPLAPTTIDPDVDPSLERIILKALAKDPAARHQNMRELRADLREIVARGLADVPPSSRLGRVMQTSDELRPVTAPPRSGGAATVSILPHEDIAAALLQNRRLWLTRLAETKDPRIFAMIGQRLELVVRALASAGETTALWALSSALHGISLEGAQTGGSRAYVAAAVLRVYDDPAVLSPVAEKLLSAPQAADETSSRDHARFLLVDAGVAGAHGLYSARVKLAHEPHARAVFANVLKDFGPKAWPVVRAALEKILATDQLHNPRTMDLAEDLLLSVPIVGGESAGHLVVKYLRVNVARVCRAATAAIVMLWRERAKPLLVGMLQSRDDVVRIAGLAGLRQLDAVDEHVVTRLHAILTRRLPAGEELRSAAAVALAHATPSARGAALYAVAQLVATNGGGASAGSDAPHSSRRPTAFSREDAVVVALARSLLALGGSSCAHIIAERADRSPEPLRTHLKSVLAGASS